MDEAEDAPVHRRTAPASRGALAEMRTLLLELRPAALTQARFPDLIKQLSEAVIGRARLPVNWIRSAITKCRPKRRWLIPDRPGEPE